MHEEDQDHFLRDKFLFQSFPNDRVEVEINELYAKIGLIKSLIKEYSALTDKDKAKIESIQEYLVRFLTVLRVSDRSRPNTSANRCDFLYFVLKVFQFVKTRAILSNNPSNISKNTREKGIKGGTEEC